jgi:hypothetical protein
MVTTHNSKQERGIAGATKGQERVILDVYQDIFLGRSHDFGSKLSGSLVRGSRCRSNLASTVVRRYLGESQCKCPLVVDLKHDHGDFSVPLE